MFRVWVDAKSLCPGEYQPGVFTCLLCFSFFQVRTEIRICILGRANISDLTDGQQKQLRMRMLTCSQHHPDGC